MRFRTERHQAIVTVMHRLVRLRPIEPDIATAVDVAGSQDANLGRTHSREPLETDHVSDDVWQLRQRRGHSRVVNWPYRRGFASFALTATKAGDHCQRLCDSRRKASLGGPGSLRGFPAARFVGEEALQLSTEARFPLPLFRPLDALFLSWHLVGFADAAAVDDYGEWHADIGAGVSGINLFSYVGFFVAQRVTDTSEPDDGPRFLVRLRRDF